MTTTTTTTTRSLSTSSQATSPNQSDPLTEYNAALVDAPLLEAIEVGHASWAM